WQAGILEAAGDHGQVTMRRQMRGEDVEGPQGMGDARVEHMTEEERGEGTVEQHNFTGEHGISSQDNLLVDAPAERGNPAARRGVKDYLVAESTRHDQGRQ